jgi:hypothetical protein
MRMEVTMKKISQNKIGIDSLFRDKPKPGDHVEMVPTYDGFNFYKNGKLVFEDKPIETISERLINTKPLNLGGTPPSEEIRSRRYETGRKNFKLEEYLTRRKK